MTFASRMFFPGQDRLKQLQRLLYTLDSFLPRFLHSRSAKVRHYTGYPVFVLEEKVSLSEDMQPIKQPTKDHRF